MSSKTPNVDLYKADKTTDADQTFNIDTMLNENWDKLDTVIGEIRTEIGEIEPEIPEASTTQKGIVQLDDTTNSTSKGKAATADAVRRVRELADTKMGSNRRSNLIPNGSGLYGSTGWQFRGGSAGWYFSKASGDAPSEISFREASGTSTRFIESDPFPVSPTAVYNLSVEFWAEAAASNDLYMEIVGVGGGIFGALYASSTDRWTQRSIDVTVPAGIVQAVIRLIVLPNKNATYKGFRKVQLTLGSGIQPWNNDSDGYYSGLLHSINRRDIELGLNVPGSGAAFIDFHTGSVLTDYDARILVGPGNGNIANANMEFHASTFNFGGKLLVEGVDLKKSVSDGKAAVRAAITGKGGTVADADGDGVPTHAELVAGINTISKRNYSRNDYGTMNPSSGTRTVNFGFVPRVVAISGTSSFGNEALQILFNMVKGSTINNASNGSWYYVSGGLSATSTSITFQVSGGTSELYNIIVEAWQ